MRRRRSVSSKDLGIDLESKQEAELFKWFLACLLFGKPIQQEVARRTYLEFFKEGLFSHIEVLDRGYYVRYDFSTATELLKICTALQQNYGTMTNKRRILSQGSRN